MVLVALSNPDRGCRLVAWALVVELDSLNHWKCCKMQTKLLYFFKDALVCYLIVF